jgi:kumamolisin
MNYYLSSRVFNSFAGVFTPMQLAALYSFPKVTPIRKAYIAIPELGGGFKPKMIRDYFTRWKLPHPNITEINVGKNKNNYKGGGGANGDDGEVILDMIVASAVYSYCTGTPANLIMVWMGQVDANIINGFKNKIAAHPNKPVCSFSWGDPENTWAPATRTAIDSAFQTGLNNGITWFVAAGDNGSSDGESGIHADYPGSSPHVVSCGGSSIRVTNKVITSEVVWDNNPAQSATGGGYSTFEPLPSYQSGIIAGSFRGVPDLAAAADPDNDAYQTPLGAFGGTSAVAPFMAALFAIINSARATNVGDILPTLYQNRTAFRDIVSGTNGAYTASTGWDACSGLGAPIGTSIASLFGVDASAVPYPS